MATSEIRDVSFEEASSIVGETFSIQRASGSRTKVALFRLWNLFIVSLALPLLTAAFGFKFLNRYDPLFLFKVGGGSSAILFLFLYLRNRRFENLKGNLLSFVKGRELVFSKEGLYYSTALFDLETTRRGKLVAPYRFFKWSAIRSWHLTVRADIFGAGYLHAIQFVDGSSHSMSRAIFGDQEEHLVKLLELRIPGRVKIDDRIRDFSNGIYEVS